MAERKQKKVLFIYLGNAHHNGPASHAVLHKLLKTTGVYGATHAIPYAATADDAVTVAKFISGKYRPGVDNDFDVIHFIDLPDWGRDVAARFNDYMYAKFGEIRRASLELLVKTALALKNLKHHAHVRFTCIVPGVKENEPDLIDLPNISEKLDLINHELGNHGRTGNYTNVMRFVACPNIFFESCGYAPLNDQAAVAKPSKNRLLLASTMYV